MIYARKADIIHSHWSFSGLIGGMVGRLFGIPCVTTLRGSDVRWAANYGLFRKIIWWCVKFNTQVVTVGEDLADQVRQWVPGGHKRIAVIPNGIDRRFWSIQKRSKSENAVTVIGNLIASKQVDVVIHAFKSWLGQGDRLVLMIIGDGPEMKRLQALAHRLSIADRIVFAGQLPPDKVAEQLTRSSMLVLASKSEGRPNVVLEAMAAGVPVVASDIAGVRELIGDNERGLLFPVGNVAQLAGCMKRVFGNPDLGRGLAERAFLWVQEQGLTWERTSQQYAELYHQVIYEYRQRSGKRSCAG